jgi:hypothetical protein
MGTRSLAAMVFGLLVTASAYAGPKEDIQKKTKEAMENYDLMDYAASKKTLEGALATAKKAKLDKDPVTAKVYLALGIASFADGDQDGAKAAFAAAVAIDSKIQIEAAYKSPELNKLLEAAKTGGNGGATKPTPDNGEPIAPAGGADCAGVKGLQHAIIDTAPGGKAQPIEVLVGSDVTSQKIGVFWRGEGATEFTEGKLTKQGECKYTGEIPAGVMKGGLIHYYVAALNENGKAVASRGSSGSPNIIELTAAVAVKGAAAGDSEDPINKTPSKPTTTSSSSEVSGGVIAGGKRPKVFFQAVGGTGFGYVSGKTEFNNPVENCCIGNSLIVLTPEIGYNASAQLAISLAGRIGFPIGANIDDPMKGKSSTMAPAVLLRARYALSKSGEGIRVMGQVGGGIIRNTIKLKESMDGQDTDIVGQGPLLLGAGVGYVKRLSGNFMFVGDLSVLGAIAVVDKLGNAPNLGSGIGADLSVGLAVGF